MKQILLKGAGYSGRGVRIETLKGAQVDRIREESSRMMTGVEEDSVETRQQIWVGSQRKLGVAAMIVAVTTKGGFAKTADIAADGIVWTPTSAEEIAATPEKYFTPKDLDALGDLYFRLHVASKAEVDSILGEALDVTAA